MDARLNSRSMVYLVLYERNTYPNKKLSIKDAYFSLRVRNELHFRSKRPVDICIQNNLKLPLGC